MAITYNIAKCRKGWGVYARAISGEELRAIAPASDQSVIRVKSGRLARKRSKQSAKNFIARLKAESREEQIARLRRVWIKTAPVAYKVVRVQNLRLYREMPSSGNLLPSTISVNRSYLEKLALHYAERNLKSFLRKGVTKYLKLPYNTQLDNINVI